MAGQPVLIVSDGTGETAQRVLRAGLRQFSDHDVSVQVYPLIKTAVQLDAIFRGAQREGAMVVSTLVTDDMREHAARLASEHSVRHFDLLGPLLSELERFLDGHPVRVPGLLHQADDRYYRRIEAIEFTVRADDGKDPRMLPHADVILVGVSRTGKTPLSTFLAHKGFKVGNQPIVFERPVPRQLFEVDPRRVFALTIDPHALQGIRRSRLREMGMGEHVNYCDMGYILAELEYAEDLFRGNGWPVVDVTNKAIEETAANILRTAQENGLLTVLGDISQL
ncbi:MAG TPA: pyruvate, water dikinase regulatory protein [Myxococcota bacterium]|nr:pyruvate, water dikinase regulatory protein [Myxococcota bacterium]